MKRAFTIMAVLFLALSVGRTFAQGSDKFIINHFVSDPKVINTYLVITDVEGRGPKVTLSFYDNNGTLVGTGRELIQPFGKLNLDCGKYVNNKTVNGTVHIQADGGNVVAEYWQFYKDGDESWKNTTTTGQKSTGFSSLVCPHFVADKSVEAYVVVANPDTKEAVVNVVFYDDSGRELGKARELLRPNGKLILKPTDYVKTQATGVAFITASGGKITGDYWQAESSKKYQTAIPMTGM